MILNLGKQRTKGLVGKGVSTVTVPAATREGVSLVQEETATHRALHHFFDLWACPANVGSFELKRIALDKDLCIRRRSVLARARATAWGGVAHLLA